MWSPSTMDPMMEPLTRHDTYGRTPEARVLIIMTGGTICMQKSSDGLVPVRGFLETCMAPRLEFNDQIEHEAIDVCVAEAVTKKMKSLRTPKSTYGKRVRYVLSLKSTPSSCCCHLAFQARNSSGSLLLLSPRWRPCESFFQALSRNLH